jgi:hypothetical protein
LTRKLEKAEQIESKKLKTSVSLSRCIGDYSGRRLYCRFNVIPVETDDLALQCKIISFYRDDVESAIQSALELCLEITCNAQLTIEVIR